MVKIYDNLQSEYGNMVPGRCMLFITKYDDEGNINEFLSGVAGVPQTNGTMFIVDEWLIEQLDKVQFVDGVLSVKDGEEIIPPVKSEKQLRMEELQRQMAELQAMPDEPADTEEQTDAPLLDYTEQPSE